MCCMYATYEVIQPNRDEAKDRTKLKFETCVTLTFRTENGVRHIGPSYVVCMAHMKWFSQIRKKPWSGHNKKFKWLVWPWPLTFSTWNGAWHIVTSWFVYVSHMEWIREIGMELQSGHDKNFQWSVWPWPWPLTIHPENGAQHIIPSCVGCMSHMERFSQIGTEPRSGHGKNF